jgi:hypothetical protein
MGSATAISSIKDTHLAEIRTRRCDSYHINPFASPIEAIKARIARSSRFALLTKRVRLISISGCGL